VPEKLKQRLEQEFKQVEVAVKRGAYVKGSGVRVRVRKSRPQGRSMNHSFLRLSLVKL